MSRCLEDHIIWTATASDAVFVVRTCAIKRDTSHGLVRKSSVRSRQTYSSQRYGQADPTSVIKVRRG